MTVVISDGHTVTKMTLLEDLSSKVATNKDYLMRGYTLKGGSPPYMIFVTRETQFLRSSPVQVSEELFNEARKLLDPPSIPTPLGKIKEAKGLITVEGQVVAVSSLKMKHIIVQYDKSIVQTTVSSCRQ